MSQDALQRSLLDIKTIARRIEEIQLLICSYRCYIRRYWQASSRRKLQFRHAADPERIIENYEMFKVGCEKFGLKTRISDTTVPNKLIHTDKSFREVLLGDDASLEEVTAIAIKLLEKAGIERVI